MDCLPMAHVMNYWLNKGSVKNKLVEFAPKFAVDFIGSPYKTMQMIKKCLWKHE